MSTYALTENPNLVMNTETGTYIPITGNWQSDIYQAWLLEGNTPDPLPAPTFADYVSQFTPGLQAWMEAIAKTNDYDSVISCISYLGSGVTQYAGDAQSMLDWRDALWKWATNWQLGFNGQLPNPIPTLIEVMAMAPQPATFGWKVHDKLQPIEVVVVPGDGTSNA
jgi:hypothetical protein